MNVPQSPLARSASPAPAIRCRFHPDRVRNGNIAVELNQGARVMIRGPGLELELAADRAAYHAEARAVTVAVGSPHVPGCAAEDAIATLHTGLQSAGVRSFEALEGAFAVAHVNLDEGLVLLATDRFSTHPLSYSSAGGAVSFSDRADCVNETLGLDPQAIFDYVYFHVIPSPRTAHLGVARLEPATAALLANGKMQKFRTWEPRFEAARPFRFDEGSVELRRLVRLAVERALSGTRSPGAYLSGGTDSSTVVGFLGLITGAAPRAFSIGFDAAGYDEMAYASIAAKHFKASHHIHYVTPREIEDELPRLVASFDQPFGNSSALPGFLCARLAASEGVDTLLAGDGGDELFGGNTRYAKQKIFDLYLRVPATVRSGILEPVLVPSGSPRQLPGIRKLASYVSQARQPMPDRMETYNLLARFGATNVFTPEFLAQVDQQEPLSLQRTVYADCSARSLVDRMLHYDWRFTLADNDLPKVVGSSAHAGMRVGFPFLDDALVDFSLTLPPALKVRGTRLRHFFKEAMRGFLPDEIINKKKHGFGLPFGPWLATDPRLQDMARFALGRTVDRGLIRRGFSDELFGKHLLQHAGYYGEMIWILCALEFWLQAHAPDFRVG